MATSSQRPTITIGLPWHQMNSDNLGVGALTLSNISILRQAADQAGLKPHFLVIGWRDPRPMYDQFDDVEVVQIRTRHFTPFGGPLNAALKRCDVVFDIGGGDSFTDIYGFKRFITLWATKFRAVLNRTPLVFSPQTIGPFETKWAPPLARFVMNRSAHVVSRDAPTTAFLKETLKVKAPILEATDVAMRLPYDKPAPHKGGPVKVGLNVSGLMFSGGYTQSNQFGLKSDYPTLIRDIIRYFSAQDGVELHLVGHVQSKEMAVEDDHRVGVALAKEFPGVQVSPFFTSPSEAKTYIAGLDFFMGARMHATIGAFSSGVPVVPMAYSRKFIGVFGTLGYTHVADCKADTADEILEKIRNGFENRDQLARDQAEAMTRVNDRLNAYMAVASDVMSASQTRG